MTHQLLYSYCCCTYMSVIPIYVYKESRKVVNR